MKDRVHSPLVHCGVTGLKLTEAPRFVHKLFQRVPVHVLRRRQRCEFLFLDRLPHKWGPRLGIKKSLPTKSLNGTLNSHEAPVSFTWGLLRLLLDTSPLKNKPNVRTASNRAFFYQIRDFLLEELPDDLPDLTVFFLVC